MGRCSGCSGDRCSCVLRAGSGTRVTGAGTQANPYVIEATGGGEGGGGGFVPGMIMPFGGSVAPAGWLIANGQAVSRSAYSALFAAIGIVYGAGDNSTTFNVPDLAGAFPLGADTGHAVGSAGGSETKSLITANLPSHSHSMAHTHDASHGHTASAGTDTPDHTHSHYREAFVGIGYAVGGTGALVASGSAYLPDTTGANQRHSHSVTVNAASFSTGGSSAANTGNTGSGTAFNIMPPFLAVTYIIKT